MTAMRRPIITARLSLFSKIYLLVIALLVAGNALLVCCLSKSEVERQRQEIIRRNIVLAKTASRGVEAGFHSEELPYELLREIVQSGEVKFWLLVRPEGAIYASSDTGFWGKRVTDVFPGQGPARADDHLFYDAQRSVEVYVNNTGIKEEGRAYTFYLGFTTATAREAGRRIIAFNIFFTSVTLVVLGGLLFVFLRRIVTRPLKRMIEGTRALARGDLGRRMEVPCRDELGTLAASFNRMASDLQKTTVSKDYIDNIVDCMLDTLVVVDDQWVVTKGNNALCELLGYGRQELMGRHLEEVLGGREEFWRMRDILLADGELRNRETSLLARDGRSVPVLLSAYVVRGSNRQASHAILTAKDITRAKQAEQALLETNQRLEQAIARANDLATRAKAASAAKSDFLANMSHEIRTPMTAILGFAEMLSTALDCCEVCPEHAGCSTRNDSREHIHTIKSNGQRLLGLINDILDLSKVEAGKMQVERIECRPVQVVEEVLSLMRVRAVEKGLALEGRYEFPLPQAVWSDPVRIRQILVNLIGNAVKFTSEGRVDVVVRHRPADAGPDCLEIEVRDTGIGMTPDQIARLYQPFNQADSTTSRSYGGTGLGLAICKKLAEALGGGVRAESCPGCGSTFYVTVSAQPVDPGRLLTGLSDLPVRHGTPAGTPSATIRLSGRILLAEDGLDNQKLISTILRKAGAEVDIVANGRLAVEAARSACSSPRPYDAILMDMQMPEMDGYQATARLRAAGVRVPVVALTAHAMSGDRRKCLDAGCDDYVTKPIDRTAMLSLLAKLLAVPATPAAGGEAKRNMLLHSGAAEK
jgi:PAS domain S-box-containing protein